MDMIVRNPTELGQIAEKTRVELGLRQTDLHNLTKLATRFIGEVEHGKDSAQIGKVMELLDSMGLEVVVRPKSDKTEVSPHSLSLSRGRFWSSGKTLPVNRIIARVLADPTENDIAILKQHFGLSLILSTWKQLQERKEVAESVVPITQGILRKMTTLHK